MSSSPVIYQHGWQQHLTSMVDRAKRGTDAHEEYEDSVYLISLLSYIVTIYV